MRLTQNRDDMMSANLDAIDARILDVLQHDAALPINEIAERFGISASACWRRIRRMEEEGLIMRRVALLDYDMLGLTFKVMANVKLHLPSRENLEKFELAVGAWPEVVECMTVTGAVDYVMRIVTTDLRAYDTFLRRKMLSLGLVSDIQTRIIANVAKRTTAAPLALVSPHVPGQEGLERIFAGCPRTGQSSRP
jgi:DNA-binding Lrp family transcriptional regulator